MGELAGCTIGTGTALEMVADANVSADTGPIVASASTVPRPLAALLKTPRPRRQDIASEEN